MSGVVKTVLSPIMGIFSGPKKPAPPAAVTQELAKPVAAPITGQTESVKEAATAEAKRLRQRKGFRSTILTQRRGGGSTAGTATTAQSTLG